MVGPSGRFSDFFGGSFPAARKLLIDLALLWNGGGVQSDIRVGFQVPEKDAPMKNGRDGEI
jgi:hypothetical protein